MYKFFYNLNVDPFKPQAGPASYYQPESLRRLLENLAIKIEGNHGLFMLTAEDGIGKSSFVNMLFHQLQESCECCLVQLAGEEKDILFGSILAGFSISATFDSRVDFLQKLTNHLQKIHEEGKTSLLILDNAQRLTVPLLDEIRQLINLQQNDNSLLSVLLVGESRTANIVEAALSASFKKKVVAHVHVEPLTVQQVGEYIGHRLKIAGCSTPLFRHTEEYIHSITAGNVKKINLLCETSLLLGHRHDEEQITESLVRKAALQLRMITPQQTAGGPVNSMSQKTETSSPPPPQKTVIVKKERKSNGILLFFGLCLAFVAVLYIAQPKVRQQVTMAVDSLSTVSNLPEKGGGEKKNEPPQSDVIEDVGILPQKRTDTNKDELSESLSVQDVVSSEIGKKIDSGTATAVTKQNEDVPRKTQFSPTVEKETALSEVAQSATTAEDKPVNEGMQTEIKEAYNNDSKQDVSLESNTKSAEALTAEQVVAESMVAADDKPATETRQTNSVENIAKRTTEEMSVKGIPALDTTTDEEVEQDRINVQKPGQVIVKRGLMVPSTDNEQVVDQSTPLRTSPLFTGGKIILETKPNSSQITDEAAVILKRLADVLKQHPTAQIKIEGYIASVRSSPENIELSKKRAVLVETQMIKLGVNPEQMEAEGLGNQHPIGDNTTAEGRRKNRRVEISILEEGK